MLTHFIRLAYIQRTAESHSRVVHNNTRSGISPAQRLVMLIIHITYATRRPTTHPGNAARVSSLGILANLHYSNPAATLSKHSARYLDHTTHSPNATDTMPSRLHPTYATPHSTLAYIYTSHPHTLLVHGQRTLGTQRADRHCPCRRQAQLSVHKMCSATDCPSKSRETAQPFSSKSPQYAVMQSGPLHSDTIPWW